MKVQTLAALTVFAVAGMGIAAPQAFAAENGIKDGSMTWGIRDSWMSYLLHGAAHGEVVSSGGVQLVGEEGNEKLQFPLNPGASTIVENQATLKFDGTAQMIGHKYFEPAGLDVTMNDVMIKTEGKSGQILADMHVKGLNFTGKGRLDNKFDDAVLATFTLNSPLTSDQDIDLKDIATIHGKGSTDVFVPFSPKYKEGEQAGPVDFVVNFEEKPGSEPSEPSKEQPQPADPSKEQPQPSEPSKEQPAPSEPSTEQPKPSEPSKEVPKPDRSSSNFDIDLNSDLFTKILPVLAVIGGVGAAIVGLLQNLGLFKQWGFNLPF
ncbi:HtaA domain-containing protein [Corynebacterium propinquum]|uniref:HtaA domain-containing protein n=1 Tax=Corynebacterium propinquum TaxID=43769 RepID=UPI0025428C7B|nr:HtaA domain-containing protein [Corynebacterium propinquum]MDK4252926.1 HtaA domain-containing protein [Corynebacterium propinquum]